MLRSPLAVGEPCPWFTSRSSLNPRYQIDTTAGRYNVLCLFGAARHRLSREILQGFMAVHSQVRLFDIDNHLFSGLSIDPHDEASGQLLQTDHGIRWLWDSDLAVSRQLGALASETPDIQTLAGYRPQTIILDERLRIFAVIPFGNEAASHVNRVVAALKSAPLDLRFRVTPPPAPVLVVPRIFEPPLCKMLMNYYDQKGGRISGFMRDVDGRTVELHDYSHKRRTDCEIEDEDLKKACMVRIHDRLVPEIHKAFQFRATRMERYVVACYDSNTSDHFRSHRDNTTKGTAHRRFAASLVLNTGEFEGGYLCFPEFGRQFYSPPAGGAVVFSCSLLHEATAVTKGRRYVFLPFLYDDAAAAIREENLKFIASK